MVKSNLLHEHWRNFWKIVLLKCLFRKCQDFFGYKFILATKFVVHCLILYIISNCLKWVVLNVQTDNVAKILFQMIHQYVNWCSVGTLEKVHFYKFLQQINNFLFNSVWSSGTPFSLPCPKQPSLFRPRPQQRKPIGSGRSTRPSMHCWPIRS